MFKKLLLPLAAVLIIAALGHAHAGTTKAYIAQLEEVAEQMNYKLTPEVRACMNKAVILTPESVKLKAEELGSVDVNVLRRNGVSVDDIKIAFKAVKPCLRMLGVRLML